MCAGTHSGNKATCLCLFAQKRRRILNGAINLIFGCYIVSIALYLRNILSMLFPLAISSISSDGIGLRQNIILHRFRCFPAVMALVLLFKSTPALRTYPHLPDRLYSLSLTVTLTLSPGCFPIRERISFRTPII